MELEYTLQTTYDLHLPACEDLWIEITLNKIKRIIGVVYRHPNISNSEEFLIKLNDCWQSILTDNKSCFILGDLNINTYDNMNSCGKKFLNIVRSNACHYLITEPTRVTLNSKTTIDHILSIEALFKVQPAVLQCIISDDHAVLCAISEFEPNPTQKIFKISLT